jgi:DNA-binding transcriptional regulator YiaG
MIMKNSIHHYLECGLNNIFLLNGFNTMETSQGKATSIHDMDGLHKAIGMFLIFHQKDLSGDEIRFLRKEMLMSQKTLSSLLGISEQEIRRWENEKIKIPKPSESLLRLLYREHVDDRSGEIASILKEISKIEEKLSKIIFKDTKKGWQAAA